MKCNNCGNLINEGSSICGVCGSLNNHIEVLTDINNVDSNTNTSVNNMENNIVNSQMVTNENNTVTNNQSIGKDINVINNNYDTNNKEEVVSVKKYLVLNLLFAIPIVGLIMLIVKAFDKNTNKNISNYAKSMLIWYLIVFIISFVFTILISVLMVSYNSKIKNVTNQIKDNIQVEDNINENNKEYDNNITNSSKFNGALYYSNVSDLNNLFDYSIPNVFENSSISTSLHYEYGDNSIFGDCVVEFNTINGYYSSENLIKEMNEYYDGENFNKQNINNIEWYSFEKEDSFGREIYFATDINNIVYLYQFEMNEEDLYLECSNYHSSIINSIKLK